MLPSPDQTQEFNWGNNYEGVSPVRKKQMFPLETTPEQY